MRTTEHISSPTATEIPAGPAVEAGVSPYTASYGSTYSIIKTDGHSAVDSVKAGPLGLIK